MPHPARPSFGAGHPPRPGDRVRVRTPGGGGYGDPAARDPAALAEDVRLGRCTEAEAARRFGPGGTGSDR